MDVRVATTIAKVSGAVHRAGLCGLLPLQTNFGRAVRETSQSNSQIQYRIILKRTVVKATISSDNQFGSGGRSRVDAGKTDSGVDTNMLINTRPVFAIVALALTLSLLVFVSLLLFLVLRVSAPLIALAMEFVAKLLHV